MIGHKKHQLGNYVNRAVDTAITKTLGGEGSGNFNHSGLDNVHGGSSSGGGGLAAEAKKYKTAEEFTDKQFNSLKASNIEIASGGKTTPESVRKKITGMDRGFTDILKSLIQGKDAGDFKVKEFDPFVTVEVVDGKFVAKDGNHRLVAYQELGIDDIPIRFDQETKQQLTSIFNEAQTKKASETISAVKLGGAGSGNHGHSGLAKVHGGSGGGGGGGGSLKRTKTIPGKDALTELQSGSYNSKIGGYTTINSYLRTGNISAGANPDEVKRYIEGIDTEIEKHKLEKDTTTWRGTRHADKLFGANPKVGDTISEKGYSAVSHSRSVASSFAEKLNAGETPRLLKINIKAGQSVVDIASVTGEKAGLGKPERELTLPRNTRYRVDRITSNVIEMSVI